MADSLRWQQTESHRRLVNSPTTPCLEVVELAETQQECNFIVFQPAWLPPDCKLSQVSLRYELPPGRPGNFDTSHCTYPEWTEANRASVRMIINGTNRILRIKQFFHDWTFPTVRLSNLYGAGSYIPVAMSYDVVWFGRDYKDRVAAIYEKDRTMVEISVESGKFTKQELERLLAELTPVDETLVHIIDSATHPQLSYYARYHLGELESPIGIFKIRRTVQSDTRQWLPLPALRRVYSWIRPEVQGFRFDSGYIAGEELALIYRHDLARGVHLWVLYSPNLFSYISFPPELDFLGQGKVFEGKVVNRPAWYATVDEQYGAYELIVASRSSPIMIWIDSNAVGVGWEIAERFVEIVEASSKE